MSNRQRKKPGHRRYSQPQKDFCDAALMLNWSVMSLEAGRETNTREEIVGIVVQAESNSPVEL